MKLLFFSHISPFLVSGLIVNSQTFTLQLVKVRLVACIPLGYRCNCKLCLMSSLGGYVKTLPAKVKTA